MRMRLEKLELTRWEVAILPRFPGTAAEGGICRALINQPMILFCDEPTGALNSSASVEVMNILNAVNREGLRFYW